MIKLIYKLFKINLISIKGLLALQKSFWIEGKNLMAVLRFSAKSYPERQALDDGKHTYTYAQLYENSCRLAFQLNRHFGIQHNKCVAVLCKNHGFCVQVLFALSRLGADIILLNIEMSKEQLARIFQQNKFDLLIYDNDLKDKLANINCEHLACFAPSENSIEAILKHPYSKTSLLPKQQPENLKVPTGGTSGRIKFAERKPSILSFAMPFFALLNQLELDKYKRVYIAVPIYHGYGLTSLLVSVILGSEIFIRQKFNTEEALDLIKKNDVEVAILVPTILQRMLAKNQESLQMLKCILSGGAPLSKSLVKQSLDKLGDNLFNLYGTSEAGFSALALPYDLRKYPDTIGKKIRGVSLQVRDLDRKRAKAGEIGTICIKSPWAMSGMKKQYILTGDMGYKNEEGYLFLKGRIDDMIVSGGENVYPKDLENILLENPHIKEVAVIGVADIDFGKRLKVYVVALDQNLDEASIRAWLLPRVARYQMPHSIRIVSALPMSLIGKLDKRELLKNKT